jgi:hypothetical protein
MGQKSKYVGGIWLIAGILTGQFWLAAAGASVIGFDELAEHAS